MSVSALAEARELYESTLDIPLKYEMPGMAMLVTRDGIELQFHERTPTPRDAGVAMTEAAVAAGASVVKGPEDQAWGERQAVLRDADGHVFCLVAPLG